MDGDAVEVLLPSAMPIGGAKAAMTADEGYSEKVVGSLESVV